VAAGAPKEAQHEKVDRRRVALEERVKCRLITIGKERRYERSVISRRQMNSCQS